ncbi:strawberry notch-like NTP hydrolase domain-containing protein [Asticcacaulis excentricus]|uniref:Putative methylase/helicase n=1 Tax=Asticcacaulis excentricus (strain ATCC 15261 / DSM 4724 / KCTC 12464 / NCIMB 9791 / VKM B-1370 / CB 48) TaxID=573065 RepID=E8RVW0_ASTEC|nr:strawberry notch family protein [Asticcacaulis excentricus]ADU15382.1 putative methylase/helicase [Asticcacaulis excentricus CB 48]
MNLSLFTAAPKPLDEATAILGAGRSVFPSLTRGRKIEAGLMRDIMAFAFGGSDADGHWTWKQAYEAIEVAQVINARRISSQIGRLEDAPMETVRLLASYAELGMTHSRRSEEQVELDQFSTPLEIAALAVLAAQIRPGDQVLEPSAGNGMLAVIAEAAGGKLHLNELAPTRHGTLKGLFPQAGHSAFDARQLKDRISTSGSFDAVVMNPPFTGLDDHLRAAVAALADNGRVAAIVPAGYFVSPELKRLAADFQVVSLIMLPANAFYKHGTSVDTGLIVIDRATGGAGLPDLVVCETLDDAVRAAQGVAPRANARPRLFRTVAPAVTDAPSVRPLASGRLRLLSSVGDLSYTPKAWSGQTRDVGLYSAYQVSRFVPDRERPHPATLVESSAMATTPAPEVTYVPRLPAASVASHISEAQLEVVIYAGQAHSKVLPGRWKLDEDAQGFSSVKEDDENGFRLRQGFFLGDGTGVGKGTSVSAVIAENMAQGRTKAIWVSKNDTLIEDARRDWISVGGDANDIVGLSTYKFGTPIRMDRGILFTTYATLRQAARNGKTSRLDQVVDWLGSDFEGALVFDESHEMANAASGKGTRGVKKASQQGLAGLLLQYRVPNARVLYVSATGATEPANLSYAPRLGLWGSVQAPFLTREDFMKAADEGGIAFMELVARELKAKGLYLARMISFEGIEIDPLRHVLTEQDVAIWDAWAAGFQMIHRNLDKALEATNIVGAEGTNSGQHKAAAKSAFASTSQRFFNALLCGLKAPTIIRDMEKQIETGHCCVVQLISTNEASMERRLNEVSPADWNDLNIDLTPRDFVTEYLSNAFPVHAMQEAEDENGNKTVKPLLDAQGRAIVSQEALALREDALLSLALLPAVPGALDAILHHFGPEKVAEVTGRSRRVVMKNGKQVLERRGATANKAETDAFNNGEKLILCFTAAGGTGRSYHADRRFANTRRRCQYLAEPGWRADVAIQGIGRTHRTNQLHAPIFRPVTTDIKGEKRFLSTIARRLDSLGALSKGERRSTSNGMFKAEDSLENAFARRALVSFFQAMDMGQIECMSLAEFEDKTALQLRDGEGVIKSAEDLPPISTFLNRLLAQRIDDQNALFEAFESRLRGIIEKADAAGTIDNGVEDLVADELELIDSRVVRVDETGAETQMIEFKVRHRRDLYDLDYARRVMRDNLRRASPITNAKSNRTGLLVTGLTTTDDKDQLVPAVRIYRPDGSRSLVALSIYEESSWQETELSAWEGLWAAEHAGLDPWDTNRLYLVSGLLLPVWKHLSKGHTRVKRLKSPSGERWLGRILNEGEGLAFLRVLGHDVSRSMPNTAHRCRELVMDERASLSLSPGLLLKSVRFMGEKRLEVAGNRAEFPTLRSLGCVIELLHGVPRVFVPANDDVLTRIIEKYPVTDVAM